MRILLWHGWLLEGSGSNVYAARVTEVWRRQGHDVLLLCQEQHPERHAFLDAWGTVGADGVSPLQPMRSVRGAGRAVLLRPEIGALLPVFVYDEYEGFRVKRFVDLTDDELAAYSVANVDALRSAAAWHRPDVVVAGHAVPGPVVARRALGEGTYVAKVHGSDLEYAVREQPRYAHLAREGLEGARAVVGATRDVLARAAAYVPSVADRVEVVPPGVRVDSFRPRARAPALVATARLLARDPAAGRGRPDGLDRELVAAVAARDRSAIDALSARYEQDVPDPGAAARLRSLAEVRSHLVGYIGKLIPEKGVHLLIQALAIAESRPHGLIVGFGSFREWLAALVGAIDAEDHETVAWLRDSAPIDVEPSCEEVAAGAGLAVRVTFTGRLDHQYAPGALAAMDVLVVPSILDEAFGMVAAEGAAAGALPLVARHSGLAEIAAALEAEVGRPGLFSFEPGPGSIHRLAGAIDGLLAIPAEERRSLRDAVSSFVAREWTWDRTADRLLAAATRSPAAQ
jgi:glycosyltransferase involved in cell wall biosynthesis